VCELKGRIEAVRLTRENFEALGAWAGVAECWGLDAPIPALHFPGPDGTRKALLGDYVIRDAGGFRTCKAADFALCCGMHNRNCEPPSELCCWDCTEARHGGWTDPRGVQRYGHPAGEICINPVLSLMGVT
jgi:hypothetical protein